MAWLLHLRCGDDNLGVNELLVKLAVLALLVGGGDKGVTLTLKPFSYTELVLGRPQQLRLVLGVLVALQSST